MKSNMRRTVQFAFLLLASLSLAVSVSAQEATNEGLSSLLDGRVTFVLPATWVVENHFDTKTQARAFMKIPNPATDKGPHRSRAVVMTSVVPENINVRHLSDGVYKNLLEGLAVTDDAFDGENWRTMVWTVKDGVQQVVLNRFGLVGRASVELMVSFPLEGNDSQWLDRVLSDFNALCASLKIDGQTQFTSPVTKEKLPTIRKVNPQQ